VQLAHEVQEAIGPSVGGYYDVKQALTDLKAAKAGRQASIKAAAHKVAGEERLDKKFFKNSGQSSPMVILMRFTQRPTGMNPTSNIKSGAVTSDTGVLRELRSYYVWLFSEKESDREAAEILLAHLRAQPIPAHKAKEIEAPFTLKDCKTAFRSMAKNKSADQTSYQASSISTGRAS
jgi:hypothetical protein